MNTTNTKDALLIVLEPNVYNQTFNINDIEIRLRYNYLIDRYFLDIFIEDKLFRSNILVTPNKDLLKSAKFSNGDYVGSLFFVTTLKAIKKDDLFSKNIDIFYFKEVLKDVY